MSGKKDRRVLRYIQPFLLVFQNLAYRTALHLELARNLLLLDIGVIPAVDTDVLSIDVVETLFPVFGTIHDRGRRAEWHR